MDPNLKALTDEELDDLRRDVAREQERRANQALIPEQLRALAKTYREGGGDEQALTDALTPEQAAELDT